MKRPWTVPVLIIAAAASVAHAQSNGSSTQAQPEASSPPAAPPKDGAAAPAPTAPAPSGDDSAELAKKLSNPVASLISVPLQFNYDRGFGPDGDGERFLLNIQPVIPITLTDDWNIISRTILPVIHQTDVVPGDDNQTGIGDILQSLFFSPKEPTSGGLIWGVGPALQVPTATDDVLGSEKLSLGPTIVLLKQHDGFTYGALANHLWSVAGEDGREDVNATFLQPFLAYTTPTAWTFTVNTETSFDWSTDQWSIPINLMASKLLKVDGQPFQLFAGVRYWAQSPDSGPEGFGLRFGITFLFPK